MSWEIGKGGVKEEYGVFCYLIQSAEPVLFVAKITGANDGKDCNRRVVATPTFGRMKAQVFTRAF